MSNIPHESLIAYTAVSRECYNERLMEWVLRLSYNYLFSAGSHMI